MTYLQPHQIYFDSFSFEVNSDRSIHLRNNRLTPLPTGAMTTLANHGVAHTLPTILTGNSAFVTAYAVANSNTNRTPFFSSVFSIAPSVTVIPPVTSSASTSSPTHPFFLNHLVNRLVPSSNPLYSFRSGNQFP